jgi:hypothetical protein
MTQGKAWLLAKMLYTRWYSMHGIAGSKEAWDKLDEWEQIGWHGVAEFVIENFNEKVDSGF